MNVDEARAALERGERIRVVVGDGTDDPTLIVHLENGMVISEAVAGWSAGVVEPVCFVESDYLRTFLLDRHSVEVVPRALDPDAFLNGYLDTILFTEPVGENDDTSLLSHGCSVDDFTLDAREHCKSECDDFIAANARDLEEYCEILGNWHNPNADSFGRTDYNASERAGTDFWLSRNGHGAGFFDRGNEPVFRRLQDAARVYGTDYIYFDGEHIHSNT